MNGSRISAGPRDLWWLVIAASTALARIIIAMDYDQSRVATTYDEARALTPARRRRWQRLLSAHVDRTAISLVVDLGCGTGRFSEMLAAELGAPVIGLDPSEKMIDQARRKPVTSPVAFGRAFAHELPLPGGCVDLVFMSQIGANPSCLRSKAGSASGAKASADPYQRKDRSPTVPALHCSHRAGPYYSELNARDVGVFEPGLGWRYPRQIAVFAASSSTRLGLWILPVGVRGNSPAVRKAIRSGTL